MQMRSLGLIIIISVKSFHILNFTFHGTRSKQIENHLVNLFDCTLDFYDRVALPEATEQAE
jgi:hypothetical protein